jgi:integrase
LAKVNYGREALNGLVFHDTRHTAITRLLEKGVPLHTVAKIAGHSNQAMTMRYAHVADDTKHKAMMSLDDSEFGVRE